MPNKTPFEIRLELLKMAKEMLEQEYFQKVEAANMKYGFQLEEAQKKGLECPAREEVPYITEADVVEKAAQLNAFVSNG